MVSVSFKRHIGLITVTSVTNESFVLVEVVGYIGRIQSATQSFPNYTLGPYVLQQVLLLVAPALFAASLYMQLGRIVELVEGDRYLLIKRRWLTVTFVTGDVISFLLQASGGGIMSSEQKSTRDLGTRVIVIGLFVQIIFFACFLVVASRFHHHLHRQPTTKVRESVLPYKRHLISLYLTSFLIFIRSIVRVVEFLQGFDGYVVSHEVFLYVFDSVPMLAVTVILNWLHPSEIQGLLKGGKICRGLKITELR